MLGQVPIILVAWFLGALFCPFDQSAPPCFNYSGFTVCFDIWQVKSHLIFLLFQNVLGHSCLFTLSDELRNQLVTFYKNLFGMLIGNALNL